MLSNKFFRDFNTIDLNFTMKRENLFKYDLSWVNQQRNLWNIEYQLGNTIPSSSRAQPSRALTDIVPSLPFFPQNILDLGAGNGRNAIYFASQGAYVNTVDFSEVAHHIFYRKIKKTARLEERIKVINHDIRERMPFNDGQFDAVLDAYCLCHFIDKEEETSAILEVNRVLKPGGILIKIHVDAEDSYYRERITEGEKNNFISFNYENGLYKRHYNPSSYLASLSKRYKHIKTNQSMYKDMVHGESYSRSIFAMVLVKV